MSDPFAGSARRSRDAWRLHAGGDISAALSEGTLGRAFHETSVERGDAPALTIEGESVGHASLDGRAARVAGWLRAQGVEPGDRVLLCAPNSIALVVAYLATLRVGGVAIPIGAALTRHEIEQIASRARPSVGFVAGPALEAVGAIAAGSWPVLDLSSRGLAEVETSGEAIAPVEVPSSSTALIAFTSGTTGRPKGVPLSHANLLSSIRAAMLAWRWGAEDLLVHALPLSHQHGLGGVHATLLAGSRAVIQARFDPNSLAGAVEAELATVLFAVPAIYRRLVDEAGIEGSSFASLRMAISGSAPLSPPLFERAATVLGLEPLERYGTTESGLDTSNPYDGPRRPGTVGIPLPGVEMAIADPEGRALEPGEDGEILFRGPQVFGGYTDEEDNASAFHPGGWFRTGDIGRVDPSDGFLTITGRAKEVIITGGLNVYPREVELALETHPGVDAAAVVGVPSQRWGEEVVAFVVASGDAAPSDDELNAFARERLAAYKCPKRVLPIDELPVNAMGKLDRGRLRELAGSSS
jgi:malonyl-CoA/methylmalonyl-CoA synthetase